MAHYDEATVRQRLEADRQRLEDDINMRTHGSEEVAPVDPLLDSGGLAGHEADDADALADYDREQAIVRNSRAILAQVNAALDRLNNGTYGTCARCGKEINPRRLEELPYALYCIEDQEIIDRETTG